MPLPLCCSHRDTFTVFLKQLQHLSSATEFSSMESRRLASLLGLVEQVLPLAALDPSELRVEGGGLLPPPAVQWHHAAGMFLPLLHALSAWTRDRVGSGQQPDMVNHLALAVAEKDWVFS